MPTDPDLDDIWNRLDEHLRRSVDEATYRHWLAPLQPRSIDGGTLVVSAPDARRGWITERFGGLLRSCAERAAGARIEVEVIRASSASPRGATTRPAGRTADNGRGQRPFNPKHTFDQFVIGKGNRFAHSAALAVAEQPGNAYNPLFIYGRPGLGKTHLLHSIGSYVRDHGGGLRVRYVTAETFANEFVRALRSRDHETFKRSYRDADVLLVDDIEFLEGKEKISEELFHTFDALYDAGSQLVFASDRPPHDLDALEERLRERFGAGLVTGVEPPDMATRLTILRKRAHHDGAPIEDELALERIAERVAGDVRSLEGALIRVVAFHSLTGRPLDAALAEEVLDGLYPSPRRPAVRRSVREIQDATCEAFAITRDEMLSTSRAARIAWPRQVAMYLSRELTDHSLPVIGREFGGRDHSTVIHACRRASERISTDRGAFDVVHKLAEELRGA